MQRPEETNIAVDRKGVLAPHRQTHRMTFRFDLGLYCLLLFATAAFSRNFAWLHIRLYNTQPYLGFFSRPAQLYSLAIQAGSGGVPIFVTEIFLVLLSACVFFKIYGKKRLFISLSLLDKTFALWLLFGLYDLARGFDGSPLLSLRDFGIVYYAVFFYLAGKICTNWNDLIWMTLAFFVGTIISLGFGTYNYIFNINFWPEEGIDWPAFGHFIAGHYGVYFLITILIGMALWRNFERKPKWFLFGYLSVATFALALTQQRSLVIALSVGLLILIVGGKAFGTVRSLPLWRVAVGATAAGLILGMVRLSFGTPTEFFGPVKNLVLKSATTVKITAAAKSADGKSPEEAIEFTGTAGFRHDAWGEGWRRFVTNPIFGEGFGKKFVFYDTEQKRWWVKDVRPHNTYLTILYKMGLMGLAVFMLIHLVFYRFVYGALRGNLRFDVKTYLLGFTSAFVAFQVYGFFNLLLESPFLALVYWSLMGLISSLIRFGERLETAPS